MKKQYRNVAFLAELLINILVFSITCAVLVGLFGTAASIARQTKEESFAGTETQAVVEVVKARGLQGLAFGEVQADGSVMCYYDQNWEPQALPGAYQIRLQLRPEETGAGTLSHVSAVAETAAGDEIFKLETSMYEPRAGGEAP